MNGFIRHTHTEDGTYRNLPEWKNELIDYGYLHFFGVKPMTLDDIIKAVRAYNEQFPDAPFSEEVNHICRSLIDMIIWDMVRVVRINK